MAKELNMSQSNCKSLSEVQEVVKKWFTALQYERKCNSTSTVCKIVTNSSMDIQQHVRELISQEIKRMIDNCKESKDLNCMQTTCSAINGCFDNFTHAVDAVKLSFSEIIFFIHDGLMECQSRLVNKMGSKNYILELLHNLSRILILVLKLKRTQNVGKIKSNVQDINTDKINNLKPLLSAMTNKIGQFLMADDVLIDTKNNLSMAGILIKEILIPDEQKLKQYLKEFVISLPSSLSEEEFKLDILRFLMCSAIINTWSVNIIDSDSSCSFLNFFILLCENYSSVTPVILNTSRTLLLLVKHDSFKNFIKNSSQEKVEQVIPKLLSCVFMLLEHPVACVRHSARDFLHVLAASPSLQPIMINSVFKLPADKRSYYISIGALANEVGSRALIKSKKELPKQLFSALVDPTIISHVSHALEFIILKDSLAEENFSNWCETWIVPLLVSLMTVLPIVAADIEKLLEKAFKKYPKSVVYVSTKWARPQSADELRYVITALKISHKQGFKVKMSSSNLSSIEGHDLCKNDCDSEVKLIDDKLLEHCLHQGDDDIRISAFSLIIEVHKSTKPYTESDFRLILYFLKYNLNNQQPATRQKILGLLRKMLVRFADSKATLLKPAKSEKESTEKSKYILLYNQFLDSLVEFCFSNIFIGCNFNRLNTVLNILLLCFENIKDMSFDSTKVNDYWERFLIALDSSYEENKELAVILSKKLDYSLIEANKPSTAKLLYEKAFSLCTHMEPPDVLTGAYLLQTLMNLPLSKEVLSTTFVEDQYVDDIHFSCVSILSKKLKEQIHLARLHLMTAATCGPMYGTLFAIRLIFKGVNFNDEKNIRNLESWINILNELIDISFEMCHLVGCVVNSSSPEGHLPNDFQTDFDGLLPFDFSEKCIIDDSKDSAIAKTKIIDFLKLMTDNFMYKFKKLELSIESGQYDAIESLRSFKSLLKENCLLINRVKDFVGKNFSNDSATEINILKRLEDTKIKVEKHVEELEKSIKVFDWPATAQVLLLCAWRSIKEASLYLGDLVTKLPIDSAIKLKLLTKDSVMKIGEELKILLCEIKHRGAFEHAYIGFTQLVNSLWKSSDKNLSLLPKQWLEEITNHLVSPLENPKLKLCSTRRSAGLPFLIQAIICSEIVSVKSATPSVLHSTMKCLINITENEVPDNSDSKIHALNILRALFKHSSLGEHVASYVARALMVAIRGSRAATWSERNSSSLLFSSLIIRVFGVSRSRDEISKKNRMTSRTFFQRYSELYNFLLEEMQLVYSKETNSNGLYPEPSLYLVLLILGRLYPPPTEDSENIDLSEFLPYINMSRRNPIMKIRELGARALVPLITLDRLSCELDDRFEKLSFGSGISQNERHGILLQIKALLEGSIDILSTTKKDNPSVEEDFWIENTKWMLQFDSQCPKVCFINLSVYIKVLHILYKHYPCLREKIVEIITNNTTIQNLLELDTAQLRLYPGTFLFLENFYFLKTDILAHNWLSVGDCESYGKLVTFFLLMLKCKISEVQAVPLRVFNYGFYDDGTEYDGDDDFSGISASIDELLILQSAKNVDELRVKIFSHPDIIKHLTQYLNEADQEFFKSKVIHRLWLAVVSILVIKNVIPIGELNVGRLDISLKIDFLKPLLKSGDKSLSTNALICYAIYLMEKTSTKNSLKMDTEDRGTLYNILNEFSSEEADIKERLAVAKILGRCCKNLMDKNLIEDPIIMSVWMIPFKLLLDDDSKVRQTAAELVHKMQQFIVKEIPAEKFLIKMKTFDWLHLPLVSLKAQECLLDSYINLLGSENLFYLIVQMLIVAVSSVCDFEDGENSYPRDEFGVFEKGNPNPFCEQLALTDLMCDKFTEMRKEGTDLTKYMETPLTSPFVQFIQNTFNISNFSPRTLSELVEMTTELIVSHKKSNKEFSLPRAQMRKLRKSLGLKDLV